MENTVFQLKFTAKQFGRMSSKAEKDEKVERMKAKKAMEKNNLEGAKIYGQNAIRKKNEALNFLRLQSRIEAVAARVDTAVKMRSVTKSMVGVTKGMERVLESMNPEKIGLCMDTFEKQFEDMDVATAFMEGAMGKSTALSTPEDEVTALLAEISDQHNLELSEELRSAIPSRAKPAPVEAVAQSSDMDDLAARLSKLRTN